MGFTKLLWILGTCLLAVKTQPYYGFGGNGDTLYVTPDGVVGGSQIVGYQVVQADEPPNEQQQSSLGFPQPDSSLERYYADLLEFYRQQNLLAKMGPGYNQQQPRSYMQQSMSSYGQPQRTNTYKPVRSSSSQKKPSKYRKKKNVKVVKKPVYVPVEVPTKKRRRNKKKKKTLSISKGFYVGGGTQLFGKFKTLKKCQRACDNTPNCFAGDFDKWTRRCYMHSNQTACDAMQPHKKLTHFKKVPCSTADLGIQNGRITLGANLDHGLLQKGIKDIQTCIKKCLQAGGGVATNTDMTVVTTPQLCFGIDYDFANHKCYFHTSAAVGEINTPGTDFGMNPLLTSVVIQGIPGGIVCATGNAADSDQAITPPLTPLNLRPNPNVINIVICPAAGDG